MSATSWPMVTISNGIAPLGNPLLEMLTGGHIALLRLQAALPPDTVAAARQAILRARAEVNRYGNASLTTIGPYLANRLARPDNYFAEADQTDAVFCDPARDPRAIARRLVAKALGFRHVSVLAEPDRGSYAPAVVRLHADGVANPLHNDHIARDAAGTGLRVAEVAAQFSCVICIQECDAGGELEIFRRRWSASDEVWKVRDGLGYHSDVVAGVQCVRFAPATGDIYVLNPTLYHAIAAASGQTRITVGFFVGMFGDRPGEAFAWS